MSLVRDFIYLLLFNPHWFFTTVSCMSLHLGISSLLILQRWAIRWQLLSISVYLLYVLQISRSNCGGVKAWHSFLGKKITWGVCSLQHWIILDKWWLTVNDPDYTAFREMFPVSSDGSQLSVWQSVTCHKIPQTLYFESKHCATNISDCALDMTNTDKRKRF